jgi:hypothetical protein
VGDSATLDDAVANLNLVSRGIRAGEADDDITIGTDGTINLSAAIGGESLASTVKGDASALSDAEATALRFDTTAAAAITIGENADLSAFASIGLGNAPLTIEAVAAAEGNALATGASEVSGILGYYNSSGSGAFTQISVGTDADIEVAARSNLNLEAFAVDGTATTLLESTAASATSSYTQGWLDADLTAGGDLTMNLRAAGTSILTAQSIEQNANSYGETNTIGIGTYAINAGVDKLIGLVSGESSSIAAIGQQADVSRALSIAGSASSGLENATFGLSQVNIISGMAGDLLAMADSSLQSRAASIQGSANA